MSGGGPAILTINGGSSSIKFALFAVGDPPQRLTSGAVERIGTPNAKLWSKGEGRDQSRLIDAPDHHAAVALLMDWMEREGLGLSLVAIGHRVVHGGPNYCAPARVTSEMVAELRRLSPFDPQHLPEEILLTEAFHQRFPDRPQVACFDTAFHHAMPRVAQMLAIPRRLEAFGVRRYGFHGLSYEYLMGELARQAGAVAASGRIILAHLGNGASLAAVRDGAPVDTSMGFTPASGVMMGSRSGDLDPGLASYLARTQGMVAADFDRMVNFESGLIGVSQTSADMAQLLAAETQDHRAAEAIALFCHQIKKSIGAFAAVLGGVDQLVFSGGIGEHAPAIRARICEGLAFLGVAVDAARNGANAALISPDAGGVAVRVIPTDEELMIARSLVALLGLQSNRSSPPA